LPVRREDVPSFRVFAACLKAYPPRPTAINFEHATGRAGEAYRDPAEGSAPGWGIFAPLMRKWEP
jgi:hypothetical protein